ncbi:hypothetical protein T03_11582 [Trichinella britovi]|uniref:Uncharacterized protein n=1 Tax=Trichinella britovi TaxID=45882 RepID=A0A0V1C7C2_TRIBR|nr:hypothetical protein T03_11582 [Trichinella britovi]
MVLNCFKKTIIHKLKESVGITLTHAEACFGYDNVFVMAYFCQINMRDNKDQMTVSVIRSRPWIEALRFNWKIN